jgi:hypothetical protein
LDRDWHPGHWSVTGRSLIDVPQQMHAFQNERARLLLLLTFAGLETICSSKLRSWIGPTNFIEGSIPLRSNFGLAGINDKIYFFGGYFEGEHNESFQSIFNIYLNGAVIFAIQYTVERADGLAFPGFRNDLFVIDPVDKTSTDISRACHGNPPAPRNYFGYIASGGKFYVMGGFYKTGSKDLSKF